MSYLPNVGGCVAIVTMQRGRGEEGDLEKLETWGTGHHQNSNPLILSTLTIPCTRGVGVLPYMSYIGMCRTLVYGFRESKDVRE